MSMPSRPAGVLLPLLLTLGACTHASTLPSHVGVTLEGLAYESGGQGDVVVFIHGSNLDGRMWDGQMEAFRARFRVIRYDLRGHGKSAGATAPIRAADDLRQLLDRLGVQQASLVGLSAGASVATDFALLFPDRVSRLVLASPSFSGFQPQELPTWFAPIIAAVRAGDTTQASALLADSPIMAVPNDPAAARRVHAIVVGNSRLWKQDARNLRPVEPPALQRLEQLKAQTLILVGGADLSDVRRAADTLRARLPDA